MNHVLALKVQYPIAIEKDYESALISLTKDIYEVLIKNIFNQKSFIKDYKMVSRTDDFNDDFQRLINLSELAIIVKLNNFIKKILSISEEINKFNQVAVLESLKNIPCKELSIAGSLKFKDKRAMWVSENVSLIKSIAQNSLKEVEQVVYSAIRRGVAHTELVRDLTKRFTISKKRAKIIARDQINKLNADLTRARHLDLGILFYKWSTSNDERVRKSHQVLANKICKYDDVTLYKDSIENKKWSDRSSIDAILSHPGQDILCRCTSVAIIPI